VNNTRSNIPNLIIAISGSQRFDIYAGPFTKNDQLTVSPFNNGFLFIPNVTFSDASQILPTLNNAGASQRRAVMEELEARELESYGKGYVDMVYRKWLEEMDARNGGFERRAAQNLTLGYVTADVCFKFLDGFGQALISTISSSHVLELETISSMLPSHSTRPPISLDRSHHRCPPRHPSISSLSTLWRPSYWRSSTRFRRRRITPQRMCKLTAQSRPIRCLGCMLRRHGTEVVR